jgi:H/ACA ribonucleoprotein complex subunit 4
MTFSNYHDLTKITDEVTTPDYGFFPDRRPLDILLNYGIILLDKPAGPTSHEVVSWVKKILNLKKAGHSGTLDPGATGLLPVGLGDATKALGVLLFGPKEYIAVARLHSKDDYPNLDNILDGFKGDIYQRPPQRSSVRRATRIRSIHELELVERQHNTLLLRVLCQAGTYVRKLIYDIGEILGCGATMIELRRTRVSIFSENIQAFSRLHDVVDAFQSFRESGDETLIRKIVRPVEECLRGISAVVIKDSAVDALCHGAQLAVPGIVAFDKNLGEGQLVGIYSMKGELVGLGQSLMNVDTLKQSSKGIACSMNRLIMQPGTYPRCWKS